MLEASCVTRENVSRELKLCKAGCEPTRVGKVGLIFCDAGRRGSDLNGLPAAGYGYICTYGAPVETGVFRGSKHTSIWRS